MGQFSKWLLHEDQKEVFDHLFAAVLNLIFLALLTLIFWLLGKIAFSIHFLKGYWVFWILLPATALLLVVFQRVFRVDMYSHFDAYVISALVLSGFLQVGWSAFAALTIKGSMIGSPTWLIVIMYVSGAISCYVSLMLLSAYYSGSIYRHVNALLGAITFIVFSVWPTAARAMYGWFFDLF
jgi:hypothetical protein